MSNPDSHLELSMLNLVRRVSIAGFLIATAAHAGAQQGTPIVTKKLTLGCESCAGAAQFGSIWDVSILPSGELLVTDRDFPILRRFDANGRSTWTGGRKGKGPGEYGLPIRAALIANGMTVVDMTNTRITDLSATGSVNGSAPLSRMPMAAAVNERGDLLIGTDDFRGTLTLLRRDARGALRESRVIPGSRVNVAVAIAPDGSSAVLLDTKKYEILRFDDEGKPLASITRDIAQVRRTPDEEAEVRARMGRGQAMVAAEAKKAGGSPTKPAFKPEELSLKDHLRIDGLRFDGAGRLWVYTQRGTEQTAVFDVFSPSGSLLGTVTLPARVTNYSLGGNWMVTGGENSDGLPVVTVWAIK